MNFSLQSIGEEDQKKIVIFIAALIAVIAIFYYFIFSPRMDRISQLESQYKAEQSRVQVIENFALAHPDTDNYMLEMNQKFMQTEQRLPNTPEIAEFLLQAEQNSRSSGIQLLSLKTAAAVNKNGYREIPLEITIKGNFAQILSFLKSLESTSRFNAVKNMTLQSKQGELDSKLTVVVYSFGTAPTQGSAAPAAK